MIVYNISFPLVLLSKNNNLSSWMRDDAVKCDSRSKKLPCCRTAHIRHAFVNKQTSILSIFSSVFTKKHVQYHGREL